jgi:hypothetical protein
VSLELELLASSRFFVTTSSSFFLRLLRRCSIERAYSYSLAVSFTLISASPRSDLVSA